jgi:hypothetical protein
MPVDSYEFEQLPDEPILVVRLGNRFSISRDLDRLIGELRVILDSAPQPVNYVGNLSKISVTFGDVASAIKTLTRGELAILRHPKLNKIITITDSRLVQMAIRAIGQQAQYGNIQVILAKSEEDALKQAREA